jgi:hypothetical protein
MKRRTILPELTGPNATALSRDVSVLRIDGWGASVASWRSPSGAPHVVTVSGSAPLPPLVLPPPSDVFELQVRLRYRAGGMAREDAWMWGVSGWRRTVSASQVEVNVRRLLGTVAPGTLPVTVGAAVGLSRLESDRVVYTFTSDFPAGPLTQRVPHGTREFRLAEAPVLGGVAGTWSVGLLFPDGSFTAMLTGLTAATFGDWSIWPPVANALRYVPDGADPGTGLAEFAT